MTHPLRFPKPRPCLLLAVVFATSLTLGCGGKKVHPRGTVSGKVTVGGKPVTGGSVSFHRAEGGTDAASTVIRADGTYECLGVPVGNCKVAVKTSHLNPVQQPGVVNQKPPEYYAQMSGDPKAGKVYVPVPKKYEEPNDSGLTFDVKEGSNTYEITLDAK